MPATHLCIVEDDAPIAKLLRQFLDGAGFNTSVVGSGEDALAFVRRTPAPGAPELAVTGLRLVRDRRRAYCHDREMTRTLRYSDHVFVQGWRHSSGACRCTRPRSKPNICKPPPCTHRRSRACWYAKIPHYPGNTPSR